MNLDETQQPEEIDENTFLASAPANAKENALLLIRNENDDDQPQRILLDTDVKLQVNSAFNLRLHLLYCSTLIRKKNNFAEGDTRGLLFL